MDSRINITNEDCMDLMSRYDDNHFDGCFTSPPYNLGKYHHTSTFRHQPYKDDYDEGWYQSQQTKVLNELYRIIKDDGSVFYNHKNRIKDGFQITPYEWILKSNWEVKQEIIWINGTPNMDNTRFYPSTERIYWLVKSKNASAKNNIKSTDVWKDNPVGTNGKHKRAFPLSLCIKILKSFKPNSKIIEPYLGSGTMAIAIDSVNKIEKMNLSLTACEIDEEYYNDAIKRIEEQTKWQSLI